MPKKLKRDPLGFFNNQSVAKHQKKLKRGTFREKKSKKSLAVPKKIERDPLVLPGMVCCAGKRKTFLVQFARPNGAI